jgi:hypothetical protein
VDTGSVDSDRDSQAVEVVASDIAVSVVVVVAAAAAVVVVVADAAGAEPVHACLSCEVEQQAQKMRAYLANGLV